MSLSDCRKCWTTPCDCGWEYRWMSVPDRIALAAVILGVAPSTLLNIGVPVDHPLKDNK